MKTRKLLSFIRLCSLVCLPFACAAVLQAQNVFQVEMRVPQVNYVNSQNITLGEISDILSKSVTADGLAIKLKETPLGKFTTSQDSLTFGAEQIVEAIKNSGIDIGQIGYSIPNQVILHRVLREISADEMRREIEIALQGVGSGLELLNMNYTQPLSLPPGEVMFEVTIERTRTAGSFVAHVRASQFNSFQKNIRIPIQVAEWKDVPVARHALTRGAVIQADDLVRARLNLASLPLDAAVDYGQVLGQKTESSVNMGEVFRVARISQPMVVEKGQSVTLLYRSGLLEATTRGTALAPAALGEQVRVKNEDSNGVVVGIAREQSVVEVKP